MSRPARNSVLAVIRFLTILSAAALALVVPAGALGAPSGGLPAYHPAPRTFGSMPALPSRAGPAGQQPFKVPFESNVHPQWREFDPPATWSGLRWQPIWNPAGCYADAGLAGPGASLSTPIGTSAPATNFT